MSEEFEIPYQDLTDININNLIVEINTLIQENIQLKETIKWYERENKQLKEEIKKYINSNDFIYDELYKKREKIKEILGDKE